MKPTATVPDLSAWPLSALDRAFAAFLQERQPSDDPLHAALAALVSHQFGRGHACLDLQQLCASGPACLGWPVPGGAPLLWPDALSAALRAAAPRLPWIAEAPGKEAAETRPPTTATTDTAMGDPACSPLVLDGPRLYLRRNWEAEQQIRASIQARLQQPCPVPDGLAARLDALFPPPVASAQPAGPTPPDWQKVACALAARRRFTLITGGPGTGKTTTVVRLLALLQARRKSGEGLRVALAAPTGKAAARLTESIGNALQGLPEDLRPVLPGKAVTLHKLLQVRPAHEARPPASVLADLVIVDEASMIDLEMMARLLAAVPLSASLILLGDKDQLASVEAGAVMAQLCEGADAGRYMADTVAWVQAQTGQDLSAWQTQPTGNEATVPAPLLQADHLLAQQTVMLRVSRRFRADSGIGQWAQATNAGDVQALQALWSAVPSAEALQAIIHGSSAQESSTQAVSIQSLSNQDVPDVVRLDLGGTRRGAGDRLAALAAWSQRGWQPWRAQLHALQALHASQGQDCTDAQAQALLQAFARYQVLSALREGPYGVDALNRRLAHSLGFPTQGWYAGRPVMVTRNDYALDLMNGDIGMCLPHAGGLRVAFADTQGCVRWVAPSRLDALETVFAMTVHKSQGSEFEHVCLVLPDQPVPVLTRELLYTGMTRARRHLTLAVADERVLWAAARARVLRSGGLASGRAE